MAKNSTTDIELLAGLSIDSSEQEILRAIKIIQKRIKANTDARFKLNVEIDETAINNAITRLQNILQSKDLKIETQDSIIAITQEANAMLDVVESARKATQEKLEFAKANERVRNSADNTANAINREHTAMNNLDDLDSILQNVNMSGRQGASVFQQFGNSLRDAAETYTTMNLLNRSVDKFIESGKEAIEITKKFDDINTNLQMATGEDKDYVKGLLDDYAELGSELGALTETVAESADTFLRQGRSMEETNQLIEDAIVLSKVAQTSGEKASEILTATINGFQLAATEGSRVNDVLSSIDLNSASSAEGIGTALTKTASMAHNAGISLEKTAAMIATIKDVTQDSDTTIGTSLKTVLSRLSSIKAGKFVDESTGEALNDVEKVLGAINISLRDVNGQFKEAEVIIDEVGMKWKTLDGNTQKAVTSAMGGSYQANRLVSMFDNYDKVIELTKIAEESTGVSLQKFNDSYLPSLEAKTNALKSSLDALATSTISDELYGSVLDTTKAIVDMTTESGILKSALIGISTAGTIYAFEHLTAYLHDATQEFANLGEAMQITRGANGTITDIQRLIDLTGGLSESQTRLLLSSRNLTDAQRTAILINQYLAQGMDDDLARATAEATLQTWNLTAAQNTANGAAITLRNTLRGIGATLLSNPFVLVTAAVTAAATAFNAYKQKQEEIIQTTKEAARESADLSDELNDLTSKYLSLADAVNDDESAKEDLLDVQDKLIEKLGLERDEIDKLIEKYGVLDEKVQNYIQNEAIAKLQEARHDLISGYNTAKDELIDENSTLYGNQWTVFSKENKEALKVLEKKGIGRVTDELVGDRFYLTGVESTVEGAIKNFNQLKDALSALEEEYGSDKVKDIGLYNDLYTRYQELKPVIEGYTESIDELNENAASSLQFTMLKDMEFPDTEEELEAFRQKMMDTALISKDFVGSQEDIERAVNSVMKTFSSYSKTDTSIGSGVKNSLGLLSDKQKESIEDFKDLIKKIAEIKENPDSYSLSDLTTEFTSYDWSKFSDGAESLDMALRKIAGGSLANVRTGLEGFSNAEPILEELRKMFIKTFEGNDFGWSENLGHYNAVMDLLNKVKEGYKFTKEEITEILGDYELFGDIKKLDGGYSIDNDALKSLADEFAKKHNESLQKVREELDRVGINPDSLLGENAYKTLFGDSDGSGSSSKSKTTFDWIEPLIEEAEKEVERLDKIANDTYSSFGDRQDALQEQMKAITNLMDVQTKAQKAYMEEANDLGLDQSYIDKIQKGELDIETLDSDEDEELIDKIKTYQDYWENVQNCVEANKELNTTLKELSVEMFNLTQEEADLKIADIESNVSDLQTTLESASFDSAVDKLNLYGKLSDEYKSLADINYKTADSLKEIYNRLLELEDIDPNSGGMVAFLNIIEGYDASALEAELKALEEYANKFQEIKTKHDRILAKQENEKQLIETELAKAEAQGYINTVNYHNHLMENLLVSQMHSQNKLADLLKEQANIKEEALKQGKKFEDSDMWYENQQEIESVNQTLKETELQLIECNNTIRQIEWDVFDFLQEQISLVADEAQFLIDLFGEMKQFDDKGQLTDVGMAIMGNHTVKYENYLKEAKRYAEELADIESQLSDESKKNDTELIKRKNELLKLYQDSTIAAQDEKQAVIDMVEEAMNLELESLQKLIDEYKEAIDVQRDLYDYQKKTANQSKNIAILQKQLASYENDKSEESKKRIQQIRVQLSEAVNDMDDMQRDHYISEQDKLLTSLYEEYETVLNERLDNVDVLFQDMINRVNENTDTIASTIKTQANNVGYILTDEMQKLWGENGTVNEKVESVRQYVEDNAAIQGAILEDLNDLYESLNGDIANESDDPSNLYDTTTSIKDKLEEHTQTVEGKWEELLDKFKPSKDKEDDTGADIEDTIKDCIDKIENSISDKQPTPSVIPDSTLGTQDNTDVKDDSGTKENGKTSTPTIGDIFKNVTGKWYEASDGTGNNNPVNVLGATSWELEKINEGSKYPYHLIGHKDGKFAGSGWVNLDSLPHYAKGLKNSPKDHWAITQDGGDEIIVREDGSVLTRVGLGDYILSLQGTKNMVDMSENPTEFIRKHMSSVPSTVLNDNLANQQQMLKSIEGANINNNSNVTMENHADITFNLPNVTNYEEFMTKMQHDSKFEKMVNAMTVEQWAGGSPMAKYNYHWK